MVKLVNVIRGLQTTLSGDIIPNHQICLADILAMEHNFDGYANLFHSIHKYILDKSGKERLYRYRKYSLEKW